MGIILGSSRDEPWLNEVTSTLESLGIEYEVRVLSAHRNPEGVREYALRARERGLEVIIALAGAAAHLPGVLASWTDLPVIGVPLPTSELKGVDSLYSIVQMPRGIPVACVAIGGATNAALLAAAILSLKYEKIKEAWWDYRKRLREG